jgi:hypothetical protein
VEQLEAVAGMHGRRLVREPDRVQGREQDVAGPVAGEHAAGAVAAVGGRREPHHQQRCVRGTEPGHRTAPVLLVAVRGALLPGHELPPGHQPGAGPAVDQRRVEVI